MMWEITGIKISLKTVNEYLNSRTTYIYLSPLLRVFDSINIANKLGRVPPPFDLAEIHVRRRTPVQITSVTFCPGSHLACRTPSDKDSRIDRANP